MERLYCINPPQRWDLKYLDISWEINLSYFLIWLTLVIYLMVTKWSKITFIFLISTVLWLYGNISSSNVIMKYCINKSKIQYIFLLPTVLLWEINVSFNNIFQKYKRNASVCFIFVFFILQNKKSKILTLHYRLKI